MKLIIAVLAVVAFSSCATMKPRVDPDLLPNSSLECAHLQQWEANGVKHENCD